MYAYQNKQHPRQGTSTSEDHSFNMLGQLPLSLHHYLKLKQPPTSSKVAVKTKFDLDLDNMTVGHQSSQFQVQQPPLSMVRSVPPLVNLGMGIGGASNTTPVDVSQVQTQPQKATFFANGAVRNLPASMMTDQFGVAALMVTLQLSYANRAPITVGMGQETDIMGDTPEPSSHKTFGGPFPGPTEPSCFSPDCPDTFVVPEYLVTARMLMEGYAPNIDTVREILPIKYNAYPEDLLFFLFYMFGGDILQMVAASHLYAKDWRYHIGWGNWIQRISGSAYGPNLERGIYRCFDSKKWQMVQGEMIVELDKLESRPEVPSAYSPYHYNS